MAGLRMSNLVDLTRTTLEDLPKLEFEYEFDYQDYEVVNRWMTKRNIEIQSGYGIKRNIVLKNSGNASHVGLYETTTVNVADVMSQLTAPWAHAQTFWSIERREALANRSPAKYVDLLEVRRADAMVSLADILEERAWLAPDSASDVENPRGIPYWVSPGSTTEDGFYGGQSYYEDTSAIASPGGINAEAPVPPANKWANYYKDYDGPNSADAMVDAMHKVYRMIQFRAPRIAKDLVSGPRSGYVIYMDGDTLDAYEKYTRKSNDQIGFDVGKFAGNTAFQRTPIIWNPQLDTADETNRGANPIYFINHNKFKPFILRGDNLRESEPIIDRAQHNVITVFVDISYNYLCLSRRKQGLISTI